MGGLKRPNGITNEQIKMVRKFVSFYQGERTAGIREACGRVLYEEAVQFPDIEGLVRITFASYMMNLAHLQLFEKNKSNALSNIFDYNSMREYSQISIVEDPSGFEFAEFLRRNSPEWIKLPVARYRELYGYFSDLLK